KDFSFPYWGAKCCSVGKDGNSLVSRENRGANCVFQCSFKSFGFVGQPIWRKHFCAGLFAGYTRPNARRRRPRKAKIPRGSQQPAKPRKGGSRPEGAWWSCKACDRRRRK